jgi:hypothetical protein
VHEDDESGEDGHEELLLPCQTTWMDYWIMYVHLVVFRLVGVGSCAGSFIPVKLVDVR